MAKEVNAFKEAGSLEEAVFEKAGFEEVSCEKAGFEEVSCEAPALSVVGACERLAITTRELAMEIEDLSCLEGFLGNSSGKFAIFVSTL